MDNQKTGACIRALRKEKGYTQKQLADILKISPKTISKWETAAGYPDISLLSELAKALGTTSEQLLQGNIEKSVQSGGNMKRIKFYRCEACGNILTGTGEAAISCCGRTLQSMHASPMDEEHAVKVELLDDDDFVTLAHPMEKEHYICFVAWVRFDRILFVRMYPEQNPELHVNIPRKCEMYVCCSKDGLFRMKL